MKWVFVWLVRIPPMLAVGGLGMVIGLMRDGLEAVDEALERLFEELRM